MLKRAVIFANGELCDGGKIKSQIEPDDFLIAVDGGHKHMKSLDLKPNLVIGDLDSIQKNDIHHLPEAGVELLRFPPEKNETDLELALNESVVRGYKNFLIVAGLGGRLDQTLGNLALLKLPALANCSTKMDDGCVEVWLLQARKNPDELQILGDKGEVVSLLPHGCTAKGIITQGLKYSLASEDLLPYTTRGISNEMLGSIASVSLSEGELIVIHTRYQKKCVNK